MENKERKETQELARTSPEFNPFGMDAPLQ